MPNERKTSERVLELVALALDCRCSELNAASGLGRHPKWDSLGHISVMVALEHEYGVTLTEATVSHLITVSRIVEHLTDLSKSHE